MEHFRDVIDGERARVHDEWRAVDANIMLLNTGIIGFYFDLQDC